MRSHHGRRLSPSPPLSVLPYSPNGSFFSPSPDCQATFETDHVSPTSLAPPSTVRESVSRAIHYFPRNQMPGSGGTPPRTITGPPSEQAFIKRHCPSLCSHGTEPPWDSSAMPPASACASREQRQVAADELRVILWSACLGTFPKIVNRCLAWMRLRGKLPLNDCGSLSGLLVMQLAFGKMHCSSLTEVGHHFGALGDHGCVP